MDSSESANLEHETIKFYSSSEDAGHSYLGCCLKPDMVAPLVKVEALPESQVKRLADYRANGGTRALVKKSA